MVYCDKFHDIPWMNLYPIVNEMAVYCQKMQEFYCYKRLVISDFRHANVAWFFLAMVLKFPYDVFRTTSRGRKNFLARENLICRNSFFYAFYCQYFFFMENLNTSVEIIRYTMLCIHKVVISGSICDISAPMVFTFTKHSAADVAGNM